MRIVAGRWRGRRIEAPPGSAVRPTLDSVREAWMNILQLEIPGARVLDLFAGSGALGLEALSRGAVAADFVENDANAIRVLRENFEKLAGSDHVTVHLADALSFVMGLDARAYDIAFADPPYAEEIAATLAEVWLERPFASILSVEHGHLQHMPDGGETRRYGTTAITFYRSED